MAALDIIASELLKSANEADLNYKKTRDQAQRDKAIRLRKIVENLKLIIADGLTPTLDEVLATGNTSTNTLDVGGITTDYVQLDTTATPTLQPGMFAWNDQDGTANLRLKGGNVTLQVGQETLARVVNKTGADLLESQYKVVRVRIASEGGSQGQRLAVVLAQGNNDPDSVTTLGIVTETILNNQEGFITIFGNVNGINTTGSLQGETWVDGDVLFLSPTTPGALTKVKPIAPNHTVVVGYVLYAHGVNGKIFVKVDNGYELDELHNVKITSVANNDLIQYDSVQQVWKNVAASVAVPTPTLAQVTTAGNTTANSIVIGSSSAITASPYTLQVVGSAGGSAIFSNSAKTQGLNINLATAGETRIYSDYFGAGVDQKLILGTFANRATQLVLQTSGNVSIGTTTDAGYKLDVNGTARVSDTATIAKALNITGTVAVTGTGNTYANTFSSNINGTFSGATIATLSVNEAGFSGTGSGIQNYAIVAGSSVFSKLTVNSQSTFTDSTAAQMRLQGYNVLTGASGNGSGTLLLTQTTSGGFLGLAATYGGGGSRISIFNQYNDGVTNSTSQVKVNIAGTDIAIFAGSGELAIGKGAALSGASLTTSTSITAASAIARGVYFNNTLVAAANNDVLVGLDINPTFTNGAFTGVTNVDLRTKNAGVVIGSGYGYGALYGYANDGIVQVVDGGTSSLSGNGYATQIWLRPAGNAGGGNSNYWATIEHSFGGLFIQSARYASNIVIKTGRAGTSGNIYLNNAGGTMAMLFGGTGNVAIGTTTDAGYKLDVNGSGRVKGLDNSSSTTAFLVQNTGGWNNLKVTNDGQVSIGGDGLTTFPLLVYGNSGLQIRVGNSFFSYDAVRTIRFINSNNGIPLNHEIVNQVSLTDNSNYVYFRNQQIQTAGSSAPFIGISIETPVNTQTGAIVTQLSITPTYNLQANTTSASIQRGIYYNPTITTLQTAIHRAIETTSGDVIFNGGNVGIGTPTPTELLHIVNNTNGNKFARISAGAADASAAWVAQNDQVDNIVYRVFGSGVAGFQMGIALARSASLIANLDGTGKFLIGTYSNTDIIFGTGDQSRIRVSGSNGNVMIGTLTDIGAKLNVSGDVNALGYRVNNVVGYTGILNIPGNPPGQQNVDIQGGIIVNIF